MYIDLILRVIRQAVLARMSGGGLGVKKVRNWIEKKWGKRAASIFGKVPEILFSIPFGFGALGPIGAVTTFFAMEVGHGNAYHDGTNPVGKINTATGEPFTDKPGSLETYSGLHWLLPKLGIPSRSKWYCRIIMSLKGTLIGLPLGLYAPVLGVLWATAYAISFRVFKPDSAIAEWLSGAFAGLLLTVTM